MEAESSPALRRLAGRYALDRVQQDSLSSLLAVLERLSPLERVVFVLHNAFDLTFDEIAPVARRISPDCVAGLSARTWAISPLCWAET